MKPAPFHYHRATSALDAVAMLHEGAGWGEARILAGGQSLVPSLAMRDIRPALLIDIMRCSELGEMTMSAGIEIGAACRQLEVERSAAVQAACPLLPAALRWVAVPQVRSRGTVVGSLCQGNPGAELPVVALALGAQFRILDRNGLARQVSAADVYAADRGATLGGLVTSVHVRRIAKDEGWAFREVQLRPGHFAIVCVAVLVKLTDNRIDTIAIAVGGLTANPYRASVAEAGLIGVQRYDERRIMDAAMTAVSEHGGETRADLHASSAYRDRIGAFAIRDAILQACETAHLAQHRSDRLEPAH